MASLATRASLVRFPTQLGELGQARGILLQLTAVIFFALMGAVAKAMGEGYGTAQVVFFRCWPALIPLLLYLPSQGGFSALKTKRPQLQTFRSIAGVIAMLCGFYALSQMAYADYVSLSYSAPLFGTIFAIILLREQVGWRRISAIAVGFIGILLVVGPSSETFQPVAIFGLATAVIYGMVMVDAEASGLSPDADGHELLLHHDLSGGQRRACDPRLEDTDAGGFLLAEPDRNPRRHRPASDDRGLPACADLGDRALRLHGHGLGHHHRFHCLRSVPDRPGFDRHRRDLRLQPLHPAP